MLARLLLAACLCALSSATFYRVGGEQCDTLANNTALFNVLISCADFSAINVDERCLDDGEIAEALKRIPEWTLRPRTADAPPAVTRSFLFDNFRLAWTFMSRGAQVCDKNDHHPLWVNVYNRVDVEFTSDVAQCLGTYDIESAAAFDALLTLPRL